jgi:hypothetical protein
VSIADVGNKMGRRDRKDTTESLEPIEIICGPSTLVVKSLAAGRMTQYKARRHYDTLIDQILELLKEIESCGPSLIEMVKLRRYLSSLLILVGTVDTPNSHHFIEKLLCSHKDVEIRDIALESIGYGKENCRTRDIYPYLNGDTDVRLILSALYSAERIHSKVCRSKRAVQAIELLATHPNDSVRSYVCSTLRMVSRHSPVLQVLLSDESPRVRESADDWVHMIRFFNGE